MGTLNTMRARHIIETQDWQLQPVSEDLSSAELLALGLSASSDKYNDFDTLDAVREALESQVNDNPEQHARPESCWQKSKHRRR